MTLVEFISSVCTEVIEEENLLETSIVSPLSQSKKNGSSSIITEAKLKKMIQDGSVSELSENCRFTPLARDIYREYNNKKNK